MIVFASRTGNNRFIASKISENIKTVELQENLIVEEPYFLLTYTDGLGEVPSKVWHFLNFNEKNIYNCKGVIASGNTNFGQDKFCRSADIISETLNIPIIRKIELRGFNHDINVIEECYKKIIVGEE